MRNRWAAFQNWIGGSNDPTAGPAEYMLLGALVVVLVMAAAMFIVGQVNGL